MFKSTKSRQVILDSFHSNLVERMALRDGIIPREKWHGLATRDDAGEVEQAYIEIVEDNFAEFTSVEPWQFEADNLLTLLCLFEDVTTTKRYFEWKNNNLIKNRIEEIPTDMLIQPADWMAAIDIALQSIGSNGLVKIAKLIDTDPSFNFERFVEKPYGEHGMSINVENSYKINTVTYYVKILQKFIYSFLKQLYDETDPIDLPEPNFAVDQFDSYFADHYQKDDSTIHIRYSIQPYIEQLISHVNGLIMAQLMQSDGVICTSLYSPSQSNKPSVEIEATVLLKSNFSEHISYLPAPRTIEEAIELRERPEVSRLADLIKQWTNAAGSGDTRIENLIASDIEKAQRELRYLDQVKAYSNSDIGIWIKVVGGQIPVFSNILSAAEGVIHLTDKWTRNRNIWVSTNTDKP